MTVVQSPRAPPVTERVLHLGNIGKGTTLRLHFINSTSDSLVLLDSLQSDGKIGRLLSLITQELRPQLQRLSLSTLLLEKQLCLNMSMNFVTFNQDYSHLAVGAYLALGGNHADFLV